MENYRQKLETRIEEMERERNYDAEVGFVGDEESGILTAYLPNDCLSEFIGLADSMDVETTISHEVPENNETVISFEW